MLERLQSQLINSSILRWYQGREPNERPIIAALAALVAVSLLWAGLWKPISDWQDLTLPSSLPPDAELQTLALLLRAAFGIVRRTTGETET